VRLSKCQDSTLYETHSHFILLSGFPKEERKALQHELGR